MRDLSGTCEASMFTQKRNCALNVVAKHWAERKNCKIPFIFSLVCKWHRHLEKKYLLIKFAHRQGRRVPESPGLLGYLRFVFVLLLSVVFQSREPGAGISRNFCIR